jgi:hypothetical protein
MANLMPFWDQQFFDGNGNPLAGGKIYAYESGTTTAKETYTTFAGTTAQAHPVVLDAAGRTTIWLSPGAYTLLLTDSDGNTVKTLDNVNASSTTQNGYIDPRDYGATGDGTTDDYDSFVAAHNAALAATLPIRVTAGTYRWASNPTNINNSLMILEPYASLKWTGFNPTIKVQIDPGDQTTHFDTSIPVASVPILQGIDMVRPEWFGAAGNGTTDDLNAIQKAINCFFAGGIVQFAQKTYKHTAAIALKAKTTLRGSGKEASVINGSSGTANGMTIAAATSNIKIEHINIYSAGASTGYAITSGDAALDLNLYDCTIGNYAKGLKAPDVSIRDCVFNGIGAPGTGVGIDLTDAATTGTKSSLSNVIINSYSPGIQTSAGFGYTSSNLTFVACGINSKAIGPYSILNAASLEIQSNAGSGVIEFSAHSDVISDSGKVDFKKSHVDDETTIETITNETIGIIRGYAVNSTPAEVLAASLEFKQDGASGASYVKTDLEISCGTAAAAPAVIGKFEYPSATNATALSVDHYNGSSHDLKIVGAGGIGTGGSGYRALRVLNTAGEVETAAAADTLPMWVKTTIGHAAVAALGASLTGTITAFAVPAAGIIHKALIHHTTAFVGCTTLTVSIGPAGDAAAIASAFDIKAAVSATNSQLSTGDALASTDSGFNLLATFASTVDNLSSCSAGSVDLWILISKVTKTA